MGIGRQPCASCGQVARRAFRCARCDSREAFAWHPDWAHSDAELRCFGCNALPPQLRPEQGDTRRAA
jgi:hypothetical protein